MSTRSMHARLSSRVPLHSMRDAAAAALLELGERDPDLIIVTADVAKSTRVYRFGERFPERLVNVGISEQDMVCFAAGLALAGKRPWVAAFAMFMMRAWEQIRNTIDRMRLDVKLLATHSGFSDHADGSSHQCLEDIALMRVLPNMVVIAPADALETYKAVIEVHESIRGPAYIRIGRDYAPRVTDEDTPFRIGVANVLRDGNDATIVSYGPVLRHVLDAVDVLAKKGFDIAVLNMHTIKPLDVETLEKFARKTGLIIVVEEHHPEGGLASAVAEALSERYPTRIAVIAPRGYGHSARDIMDLYRLFCLTPDCIANRVEKLLRGREA